MGALKNVVESFIQLGVNRFRRHEHQGDLVGLAWNQIFLGDVGNVLVHIGAQALGGGFALILGLGFAIGRDRFEGELGVDRHRALVGEKHATVGPGAIRKRALKFVSAL